MKIWEQFKGGKGNIGVVKRGKGKGKSVIMF